MDTETAAVSEIKSRIANTDRLSQYINERDKEPIWDGSIYAYKGTGRSNDEIIGRVPVQVKGKNVKKITKDSISFPVSVTNLKRYRDDGGVLFLVVCLAGKNEKRVYYSRLLPYLLTQYIDVAHGKQISITLKKLPDEDYEFENIVINFINDSGKQPRDKNWTIEEVEKLLGKDNVKLSFNYTCIGYDKADPFSYLKNNEIYLYMGNKEGTLKFPVQRIENAEMVVIEQPVSVSANRHDYYQSIKVERHRDDSVVINMGKSFKYIYEGEKATFKYDLKGNLDEQIETIHFLLDIIDDHGLYINGEKCPIEPTKKELESFNRESAEQKLKYLCLIKEVFDRLGVKEPLELEQVSPKQEDYIRMLINCILNGRRAGFTEKGEIPPAGTITIANLHIMLFFRQMKDERYEISDFFRNKVDCKLDIKGKYDTTQFSILTARDYLEASNIDLDVVEHAFMEHHNQGHFERTTLCVLEMIKAYDLDSRRSDLLKMAERLNQWLIEQENINEIHYINLYQCYKRQRELSKEEESRLEEFVESASTNDSIKAAAYILLDSKKMAGRSIEKLGADDKAAFLEFPIYHLYDALE